MKKKLAVLLLAACLFTACGANSKITTGNKPLSDAVYSNEQVSLAAYTGLKAEKKDYIVTDDAVNNAIHEDLLEYAEYKPVSRASKNGDWVYTDFKASIDGKTAVSDSDYEIILGAAEFGEEFDKKLTGVSIGDSLNFSLDYDSEYTDVEWAGNTVDFEIKINDIHEEILPDATDSFIKENTEYSSYEDFTNAMRKSVTDMYAEESTNELQEELLQQVIDSSSILEYTQEEYDAARNTIESGYMSYVDMFGFESLDALYESFEMTDEDVEDEIQSVLYRTIVLDAIVQSEKLSLSDEDYEDGIVYYMDQYDYDSKDEFLDDYGEDEVRRQLTEDMVLNFLVNHADVTEVEAEYEDE